MDGGLKGWLGRGPGALAQGAPLLLGVALALGTLALHQGLRADAEARLRAGSALTLQSAAQRVREAERQVLAALRRMAERWADAGAATTPVVWQRDAERYLADLPSLDRLALVGPDLRILALVGRSDLTHLVGERFDSDSLRADLAARARATGEVQVGPLTDLRSGVRGAHLVYPVVQAGELRGFVVAGVRMADLVRDALVESALGFDLEVGHGTEVLYARAGRGGPASTASTEARGPLETGWGSLAFRVGPGADLARDQVSIWARFVLALGLLCAVALGSLLHFALAARHRARELAGAHQRLRDVFDNAQALICAFDPAGCFVALNAASRGMLGYAPEELLGTSWASLIWPGDLARAHLEAERVFGGGRTHEFEVRFVRKDGSLVDLSWSSFWSPRDQLVYGMARDVTARKRRDLLLAGQQEALTRIAGGATTREVLEGLCGLFAALFPAARPTVLRAEGTVLRSLVSRGFAADWDRAVDGLAIGPASGVCGVAAHTRAPRFVADVREDPACADWLPLAAAHGVRAGWSTPLLGADGTLFGTFALYLAAPGLPDAEDQALIDGVVRVAVLAFERERLDRALRVSARRLTEASHIAHLGHWEFDLATGILHWSEEVHAIFGVPAGEFGRDFESFIARVHPLDRASLIASQQDVMAGRTALDAVHRIVRGDGEVRWVHERAMLERDASGAPMLLVGTVQDVTDLRRLEAQVAESEARHRLIIEQTGAVIYDYEVASGRITWSGAFGALLGEDQVSIAALDIAAWEARIHADDRARAMTELQRAFAERRKYEVEYRFRRADGTFVWVRDEGVAYHDPHGQPERMLGALFDVSMRHALEETRARAFAEVQRLNAELERRVAARTAELETVNRELEAFAYSVSHDLRAPLRAVAGFSRLLAENQGARLDEQGRHFLARIQSGTERMGELIEDLLELSRVSRQSLTRASVDLSTLAARVLHDLAEAEPGRRVTTRVAPGLTAEGDPRLLAVALGNLLSNAWKFTAGRAEACVEVGTETGPDGVPVYFVRDDGAGFDPRYADRMFGVFQRLHSEAEFPGTGVGLAIVRRVIERHGGRVWAEGAPGRGCTFRFTLAGSGESGSRHA